VLAADGHRPARADDAPIVNIGKRIMVGFDGSPSARRALDRAGDLAGYGSTVTVVTVSTPQENGLAGRLLFEAKEQLSARLVPSHTLNPVGDPAEELLKAASGLGADVIVVGTQPNGTIGAQLLARSPCDVLVVR
jgi:nucleotide-binding universal stress UspA family protein